MNNQEAIDLLDNLIGMISDNQDSDYDEALKLGIKALSENKGEWIPIDDFPHEVWECDHCGFVIDGSGCIEPTEYRDMYNFCPNCGADMRGGE